jgi:choline transport protein
MSIITWQATMASAAFLSGTMVQGLVKLNHPDYIMKRWHGTLIFYAVVFFSLFINTYLARILPEIEALVLLFHLMGYFAVLIPLVYLAPHGNASSVFANFTNEGGWSPRGLSFFIGTSTGMFSFIGMSRFKHMYPVKKN